MYPQATSYNLIPRVSSERRIEKLNILLTEELSRIIDREFEFPSGTMVTITHVDISSDKRYATVFVSLLGSEPRPSLALLKKNIYHIQQMLNRRLRMRPVPQIHFALDEGEWRRESIEKSLVQLKRKGEI